LDVLILGQNLSGNGTKVEFKNSSGITKSATNFSVISANGIKARVPSLSPGSYTIQLTIDGMIALPFAGNPINETLNITQ
jgi:hypothetical protein